MNIVFNKNDYLTIDVKIILYNFFSSYNQKGSESLDLGSNEITDKYLSVIYLMLFEENQITVKGVKYLFLIFSQTTNITI